MKRNENADILDKLPEKLVQRLMPFQKKGVEYAVNKNGRCLIADEMGLGKTLQAISVAYYYKNEWPLLIIVPSSLRYCWIEEFEKWLPDISPGDINLIQSGNDVSEIGTALVNITTFGLLSKSTSRILKEALFSQGFQVVIVDESHYIRNGKTVSAKTVVPLVKNANRRILLSGTPALSRPVELYPQIDAICPDKFGSWWAYTNRYCDAKLEWIGRTKRRNVNGASNLEELQHRLSSNLMIRREKSQVLTQLPPKQRQKVLFELKDSDLKKEIRQTFDELRPMLKKNSTDKYEVLTGGGEHGTGDTNMLSLISRLYLLSGEAKIGPAKEYIEMLCENQKLKFLVFAYHHSMMNGLSESLHDKRVKFIRIDGDTPQSERPHLVHQFQSDPDTRVAVLSILAAGVGLTFTAATIVVFAEMYWTPGTMIQCEDRAHRIGQTSCVAVHYLVAKDTMDEWVWSAVCKKTIVTSTTLTGRKRKMEALEGDRYQVDVLSNADVWVPTSNNDDSIIQSLQTQLEPDQPSILTFFSSSQNPTPKHKPKHQNRQTRTSSALDLLEKENNSPSRESQENNNSHVSEIESLTPARKKRRFSDYFGSSDGKRSRKAKVSVLTNIEKELIKDGNETYSEDNGSVKGKADCIVIDSDEEDFAVDKITPFSKSSSSQTNKGKSSSKKGNKKECMPVLSKYSLKSAFAKASAKKIDSRGIEIDDENVEEVFQTDPDSQGSCTERGESGAIGDSSTKNAEQKEGSQNGNIQGSCIKNADREWNCVSCTFLNHKALKYCEMCETPKKMKNKQKLTEHNTSNRKVSEVCGYKSTSDKKNRDESCTGKEITHNKTDDTRNEIIETSGVMNIGMQDGIPCKVTDADHSLAENTMLVNKTLNCDSEISDLGLRKSVSKSNSNTHRPNISDHENDTDPCDETEDPHVDKAERKDDTGQVESDKMSVDEYESPASDNDTAICVKYDGQKFEDRKFVGRVRGCHDISESDEDSDDSSQKNRSGLLDDLIDEDSDRDTCDKALNAENVASHQSERMASNGNVKLINYTDSRTTQSKYFNAGLTFTSESPSLKKKEMVVENTLTQKNVSKKGRDVNEDSGNDDNIQNIESSKLSTDHLAVGTNNADNVSKKDNATTPGTSAKKYRFKSLQKNRNSPVCNSPVFSENGSPCVRNTHDGTVSSPVMSLSGHVHQYSWSPVTKSLQSPMNTKSNSEEAVNGRTSFGDQKTSGQKNGHGKKADILKRNTNEENLNKCDGDILMGQGIMDKRGGKVGTPKRNIEKMDDSFDSPEMDNLIAAAPDTDIEVEKALRPEKRVVDIDSIPIYGMFKYRCSKYTGRIYLLTKDDVALEANFIPTDVEVENLDALPDVLLHPGNLRLVHRFVREWISLSETKRRLLVKSCVPFISPLLEYERLRSCKTLNPQRYKSKTDTGTAARQKAADVHGSVRSLSKPTGVNKAVSVNSDNSDTAGVMQAVSEDGTPHCLQCMKPYKNHLLQKTTIQNEENAWQTRFCSRTCSHEYWMLTNTEYIREKLFEAEHGICQLCQLDAHSLFRHIKDTPNEKKRVEILGKSPLTSLSIKVKHQMVKKPAAGLFWHADHIVPVWEGGGQCDIDNLRTLCVKCHQQVTAKQAGKRATVRKLGAAVKSGDITAFFQKT